MDKYLSKHLNSKVRGTVVTMCPESTGYDDVCLGIIWDHQSGVVGVIPEALAIVRDE